MSADDLAREVRDALNGDSNDAEHDALVSVACALGLKQTDAGRWVDTEQTLTFSDTRADPRDYLPPR